MTDGERGVESEGEIDEAYADLGATTENAMAIAETSMDIVRQFVPDDSLADRVRQKSVHSMGDIEFQHLLRFTGGADLGTDDPDAPGADPPDEDAPVHAGARAVLDEA